MLVDDGMTMCWHLGVRFAYFLCVPFCSRFYLCCALRLRADEVDAAGEDMPHLSLLMYHGYQ